MTIDDMMTSVVQELVSKHGTEHEVSRQDLIKLLGTRFNVNPRSVLPPDYCYNRTNNGIDFRSKPHLFEYLGPGRYRCLGKNYAYNGPVYAKNKGSKAEFIVGKWVNGKYIG